MHAVHAYWKWQYKGVSKKVYSLKNFSKIIRARNFRKLSVNLSTLTFSSTSSIKIIWNPSFFTVGKLLQIPLPKRTCAKKGLIIQWCFRYRHQPSTQFSTASYGQAAGTQNTKYKLNRLEMPCEDMSFVQNGFPRSTPIRSKFYKITVKV